MTQLETHNDELPFRSDFAARVMKEADAIATRRRRVGSALAAAAVTIAAVSTWQMWPSRAPDTQRIPREVASSGDVETADFQSSQPTLLDFVFPDAAALSRFSDRYSDSDNSDVMEYDAVFFPDAEDVATIDNS